MDDEQQPWSPSAAEMDQQRGLPYSTTTAAVPGYADYGCQEEYVDARMELPEDQNNFSDATTSQLGRVETTEMMDTGESSATALQPAQWQQIMLWRQFFEIDGTVQAGTGWRVVLSIVSAFRRLSGLVRMRRSQRPPSVRN